MEFDKDFKANFTVNTKLSFDSKVEKDCLDVMTNVSKNMTRFYYETIEAEYLKNMPDDILVDTYNTILGEIERRRK